MGLATPLEVYQSLAAEGFQLSYRRIPLSRERTPEAADLDTLHSQLLLQPEDGGSLLHVLHVLTMQSSRTRARQSGKEEYLRGRGHVLSS